eukprot:CAMPEP_0171235844 /NCGR_PEP_ID=MMETSP0790-20130122/42148_1 /TAXON_ID=2925 /ORGANISM="Alexandrium catenella, Strain OF101" /LENGTH=340 /DNA_ID=CAMNT_0011702153 /DNA_START=423 /DNA_END=1447 /DNA_ORIENTATION=+
MAHATPTGHTPPKPRAPTATQCRAAEHTSARFPSGSGLCEAIADLMLLCDLSATKHIGRSGCTEQGREGPARGPPPALHVPGVVHYALPGIGAPQLLRATHRKHGGAAQIKHDMDDLPLDCFCALGCFSVRGSAAGGTGGSASSGALASSWAFTESEKPLPLEPAAAGSVLAVVADEGGISHVPTDGRNSKRGAACASSKSRPRSLTQSWETSGAAKGTSGLAPQAALVRTSGRGVSQVPTDGKESLVASSTSKTARRAALPLQRLWEMQLDGRACLRLTAGNEEELVNQRCRHGVHLQQSVQVLLQSFPPPLVEAEKVEPVPHAEGALCRERGSAAPSR